jgi:hypothetical protein
MSDYFIYLSNAAFPSSNPPVGGQAIKLIISKAKIPAFRSASAGMKRRPGLICKYNK